MPLRTHFSHRSDLVIDPNENYDKARKYLEGFKPGGFWYGISDSWRSWCKAERYDHYGKYLYIVDTGNTKILRLTSYEALRRFADVYDAPIHPFLKDSHSKIIRWDEIRNRYDGIEIAPYHRRARMELPTLWYNTWDVASGCIWNMQDVSIRRATKQEKLDLLEQISKTRLE